MADASARRSFHGPLQIARGPARAPRAPASCPLELVPASPSQWPLGTAVIQATRVQAPTGDRESILARVLSALQLLTRVRR
jgi:hypothetical protein